MMRLLKCSPLLVILISFGFLALSPPAPALSPSRTTKEENAILTIILKDGRVVKLGDRRVEEKNTNLPIKSPGPSNPPGRIRIQVEPQP